MTPPALGLEGVGAAWEMLEPYTRRGTCRNCERMWILALPALAALLTATPSNGEAARLLRAIRAVREPRELHHPLGCDPCTVRTALSLVGGEGE